MSSLFQGLQLLADSSGREVSSDEILANRPNLRVVVLYFSAHWCPPCRQFTPMLKRAWEQARGRLSKEGSVQVVFVSSDRSRQEQLSYMREAHGDWPAVPQGSPLQAQLSQTFSIRGIPALIAINASDGSIISSDGRQDVMSQGAEAFLRWESMAAPPAAPVDTSVVDLLMDNPKQVSIDAIEILVKLLKNVIRDPENIKYRSVKLSNAKIESKLLPASGAFEVLFSVGFEEGDDSLILPLSAPVPPIKKFYDALSEKLQILNGGAARPAAAAAAGPSTSGGASGGARRSGAASGGRTAAAAAVMTSVRDSLGDVTRGKNVTELEFTSILESERRTAAALEDPAAQDKARSATPADKLKEAAALKFSALKKEDATASDAVERDLFLLELLDWFKSDFFSWVNAPDCDKCNKNSEVQFKAQVPATPDEQRDGARNVEGYNCTTCASFIRFPRYNNPVKLLETRRGRCGEWANCFALILRSQGFEVRHVIDTADHVWVEVYSDAQKRWMHADPCENICDKPLVYELGWGKKLVHVIAASATEIQDVSWRYSNDHNALRARRRAAGLSEKWLRLQLLERSAQLQMPLSQERRTELLGRRLRELVELMMERKSESEEEQIGRQSGSLLWRKARGEIGEEGDDVKDGYVWVPSEKEKKSLSFSLEYDVVRDKYVREGGEVTKRGWRSGVKTSASVFRKEEKDWGQYYLARTDGSDRASVSWEIDLSGTDLEIRSIELDVNSSTYEDGRVVWQLCGGNTCLLPRSGVTLKSEGLAGSKKVSLTAMLSGGKGDVAWQHTQLFRTHKDVDEDEAKGKFRIVLKLQKEK